MSMHTQGLLGADPSTGASFELACNLAAELAKYQRCSCPRHYANAHNHDCPVEVNHRLLKVLTELKGATAICG